MIAHAAEHSAMYLWPTGEQRLLLEAGLFSGQRAIDAFHAWRSRVRLEDDFSVETLRLLPLVYDNLHELGVSDPIMPRLKGVYRHSWYRTNRLMHATAPVITALSEAGIPVLLTKGVPLALSYYRNPALRPMADVDVVVPHARLDEALGIMAGHGWRGEWPESDMRRFRHARQSWGPGDAEVDLHWRPMYESPLGTAEQSFFETAEPLDFKGTAVLQPDPTHALVQTVVHGVRWNVETPVRWIADAVTILRARGAEVDWDAVLHLADTHRVGQRLYLGLAYLAESFGSPIPPSALERLRARRTTLFERFESRVVLDDDGSLDPSALRTQLSWFAEYARHTPARNPISFAVGYTHYVRYRFAVPGRRYIFPRLLRSLARRTGVLKRGSGTAV